MFSYSFTETINLKENIEIVLSHNPIMIFSKLYLSIKIESESETKTVFFEAVLSNDCISRAWFGQVFGDLKMEDSKLSFIIDCNQVNMTEPIKTLTFDYKQI